MTEDQRRRILWKAHKATERNARHYAQKAREAGETDKARRLDAIAAQARRKAEQAQE